MTGRERFLATIDRQPVDRPAWWLGDPLPQTIGKLCRHCGVADFAALKRRLGDDVWSVNIPFHCPPSNHIACAFSWAKEQGYNDRTLTAPGFFEGVRDPRRVGEFAWPDPVACMDAAEVRAAFAAVPSGKARLGLLWSCHFQDAFAAFGMEDALVCMIEAPDMFRAVIDRITGFYLRANAFVYGAAGDRIDAVLIGNDVGCQTGLMLSPGMIREFMLPGTRALIGQAHERGLKVIHHSCGSIRPVMADIVAAGADAIHPIQALAAGMAAEELAAAFPGTASFCGGLDVQQLMVHGTPADVERRVAELRRLFPTGLVLSPSHEALLADVPCANVEAFGRSAGLPGAGGRPAGRARRDRARPRLDGSRGTQPKE
jgi:uroporphyrinogen decarboxylase